MKKENLNESFNDSLIHEENINFQLENKDKKISSHIKEKENLNLYNIQDKTNEKNNMEKIQNYFEDLCRNYNSSNNNKFLKKINNEKVNNTLNDIYGAISNINEINEKVKNFMLKRKIIPKSVDNKAKNIKKEKNKKNKTRASTDEKIINSKEFIIENKENKKFQSNITNNKEPKIIKNIYSYNNKNINKKNLISENDKIRTNSNIEMKYKKIDQNNSYNINLNIPKIIPFQNQNEYIESIFNKKYGQNNLKNINNNKLNNDYFKSNENFGNNYSIESGLISNDISNIGISSIFYNEEIKNEKDIKNIKIQLKKEEKKLKNLEEEKHKLLREEKIRRRIIMDKIKKRNNLKKQSMIKEYKKKLSIIKILQKQNMNEIIQLEKNKEIDEGKIKQINNLINEEDINKKLLKLRKNKVDYRKKKSIREKKQKVIDSDIYETEKDKENQNNLNKFFTFSEGLIKDYNKSNKKNYSNIEDKNLINEYKYFNSKNKPFINDARNILRNDYRYITPKSLINKVENDNYNLMENNRGKGHANNQKLNFEEFMNNQNNKKNFFYNNYNSDSRKYNKKNLNNKVHKKLFKKCITSDINIPSFIKERANKYNYTNSRKSSTSHASPKFSVEKILPYSLNYNFSCKYNYNISSNRSYSNYHSNNKDKNSSKRNSKKMKEFNYKSIIFNIE